MDAEKSFDNTLFWGAVCWGIAALAGLLFGVMMMFIGGTGLAGGVLVFVLVFLILGLVLSWNMMGELPPPQTIAMPERKAAPEPAKPAPEPKPAAAESASTSGSAKPVAPVPNPPVPNPPEPQEPTSTLLPGEQELAGRKGEWKYEAPKDDAPAEAAPAEAAPAEVVGTKPQSMDAAREGGPDDLTQIKGVGQKLEALLHSMGFFHYDQIAAWTDTEIAWVDENLEGFKGRVSRDEWVAQAKVLAAGGTPDA